MIDIPGYSVREIIAQNRNSIVYRGYRSRDNRAVIFKTLNKEYPSSEELAKLRYEYELEYELVTALGIEGVVKPYALGKYHNNLMFIMEDLGESLNKLIARQPVELEDFFRIALQIAGILGEIHRNNIIHKDLKSSNIVVNPKTGRVGVIDFGIASRRFRERQKIISKNVLEGSLAYISPEQTGRMNRSLDYRTDFYSLGVTFYEMLAGRLPFDTVDPLEQIHCHIAKNPEPLYAVAATVPSALSAVVMKLLSKTAEDRYQSTLGLKADLETCYQRWRSRSDIIDFTPGLNDVSEKFQISQKLYGREAQINTLLSIFERAAEGKTELVLVGGYSGVGKTSLIEEIHKPVVDRRGYFITGKFDQYRRNTPYFSLIQSFQDLVRQLLTERDDAIQAWKTRLLDALGDMGQVIINVIPEVELIIGKQPAVIALEGADAENRFRDVFEHFVGVFATAEHPLVIFLDDLQWADQASLKFIQMLTTASKERHLLLVGAYRDNEASPSHPLMLTLDKIQADKPVHTIILQPLGSAQTEQLVADSLHCALAQCRPLADLLHRKTLGNPFFLNQFLMSLYENELLDFDLDARRWVWDINQVQQLGASANVVELMAAKLDKLSDATQGLLRLASCLGNTFDLDTLAVISERLPKQVATALWDAVSEGLLIPLDDSYRFYQLSEQDDDYRPGPTRLVYRFLHDRVHEAAYNNMSEARKKEVHLAIGRLLLAAANDPETREERIFDLVNHLNLGVDFIDTQLERTELGKLNLIAGKKARSSTAHFAALEFFKQGIALMPEDAWESHYAAMFELHRNRIECEYLCGDMNKAEAIFALTLAKAQSERDSADLYELMMGAYMKFGRFSEGVELGRRCLRLFGIELPEDPAEFDEALAVEYAAIEDRIAGRDVEELARISGIEDRDMTVSMSVLHQVWTNAYFAKGLYNLGTIAALKIATLSLSRGHTEYSSFGYITYALNLSSVREDYDGAYAFGKLAIRLQERFNNIHLIAKINNLFAHMISHYKRPLRENVPYYEEAYRACLQTGDLWWGLWAVDFIVRVKFIAGDPLAEVYKTGEQYSDYARQSGNDMMWQLLNLDKHIALCLQGKTEHYLSFSDADFNEYGMVSLMSSIPFDFGLFWFDLYKSLVFYLYGDIDRAWEYSVKADKNKATAPGIMMFVEQHFYNGLIAAAYYERVPETEQAEYLQIVTRNLDKLRNWGEHGPDNRHKYCLLAAEHARITGANLQALDFYEKAIESAAACEYLHNQAIANERAADFHLAQGREKAARGYLIEAHYLYTRWGATVKARRLEEAHGWLRRAVESDPVLRDEPTSPDVETMTDTSDGSGQRLDLLSVIKAAQTISEEIVFGQLLESMLKIVNENAGAQRGLLLLEENGRWFIEGESRIDKPDASRLQSIPLEDIAGPAPVLAAAIVSYVLRTRETVVLNDAAREGPFTQDAYIVRWQPKSVLCMPLLMRGRLAGILYLENNLIANAFTRDRLEVLNLLSAQMAISIENARLYASLEQKVQERTAQLAAANAEITQLNQQLESENLRMSAELDVARRLQQMLLPKQHELTQVQGLDIAGFMQPTDEVGGDYYDVLQHGGRTLIGIGDVIGHGLESGVLAIMVQAVVRGLMVNNETDPVRFLNALNQAVYGNVQRMGSDKNISFALLEVREEALCLSGQHEEIILVRDGELELISTVDLGFPLGLLKDISEFVSEITLPLNPGDLVVLYTDGITEAEDIQGEQYGLERLCTVVRRHWQQPAETLCRAVIDDLYAHIADGKVFDDITLLVLKKTIQSSPRSNDF